MSTQTKNVGVEAGDRALETARNERATFEEWLGQETCEVHCDESANKNAWYGWQARAALIQSAMNAQERELREALRTLYVLARVTVSGHKSGREHHPELHLCESCNSNVADLCEGIAEAERLLAERGEGAR